MGGSLTEEELLELKCHGTFVETGTYKADSTIVAAKIFEKVHTIEICQPLYEESLQRIQKLGLTNVVSHLGDSLTVLPQIMKEVTEGVFFIDAHISGVDSSWNTKDRVPLFQELDAILSPALGPSIFIIDDVRLWKTIKAWDWGHISDEAILIKFAEKKVKVSKAYEKEDRFYVHTY